ncbi:MAG: M23 family metallopeptidase, partial [Ruminococcaceae bacterium]|nr:M23 family metallopeptidase [Oscillospiraceae bacterium]
MRKRLFSFVLVMMLLCSDAQAGDYIKWVDFDVSLEAMEHALSIDVQSRDTERPLSWIDLLALAATHCGGKNLSPKEVDKAKAELLSDQSIQEQLGERYKYYTYYRQAYGAALGGLVGCYAICTEDENGKETWKTSYGLKAFSPIAAGYGYAHYDDFGASRSYGFQRKHLGHDMMGALGTPIVAVEGGIVEAAGWNQYGGWRVG